MIKSNGIDLESGKLMRIAAWYKIIVWENDSATSVKEDELCKTS